MEASEDALECSATVIDGVLVVGESIERNSGGGRRRSPPWNNFTKHLGPE